MSYPIIFSFIIGALLIIGVYMLLNENMDIIKIKDTIPKIIKLSKYINNVERMIQTTINIDIIQINKQIEINTELTIDQIYFLEFIQILEIYQPTWDQYVRNNLIHNMDITMPYIVAHKIRELLQTPMKKDDETNEDIVWLSKVETINLLNYYNKKRDPISPKSIDHVSICVKCREKIEE
jgi:hypothetical protein